MAPVCHRRIPKLTLKLPPSSTIAKTRFGSATSCSSSDFSLTDYEKLAVLGHGNEGTVYKVRHRATSSVYALKSLTSPTHREAKILRRTAGCPHVVSYHHFVSSPSGDLSLLLELVDGGSLDSILRKRNQSPFPEPALASIARQTLTGLSHLNSLRIVHRDLKPSNLLLSSSGEVKISDFGIGKILRHALDPCKSCVGTTAYMSPERFDPLTYGGNHDPYAADMWSLGITIWELKLGYFPLLQKGQRPDWASLACAICFGQIPNLPENEEFSPEIKDFITLCLKKESNERATIRELLNHPFINGGDQEEEKNMLSSLLE